MHTHTHTRARVHPHKTIIRQLFLHLRIQIQRSWPVKLQQTLSMRQISDDTPAHHVWLQRDQWFIWLRWSTHRGSEPSTNAPRLVTKRPVVHLTQMEHSPRIWTLNQCTMSGYKETSGSFDTDGALTVDLNHHSDPVLEGSNQDSSTKRSLKWLLYSSCQKHNHVPCKYSA